MGLTEAVRRIFSLPISGLGRLVGWARANRISPWLSSRWERELGTGQSWTPLAYGEYYPRSSLVYSAIKVRQDAIVRVPLKVYRRASTVPTEALSSRWIKAIGTSGDDASKENEGRGPAHAEEKREGAARERAVAVGPAHPAQRLLDAPNPYWTRGDLWRATETYLDLWGSAYWGLERDGLGRVVEIWPLRSDRMRVVPDAQTYIKGFVYVGQGRHLVTYLPEDIVWIRYFNPLDEYAGLSPVAPLRLSADIGLDALRAGRSALTNDSTPGLFIETSDTPTDEEVKEFYERWESRFKGVGRAHRPALLSAGMKATNLGFSPKEMEYVQSLRWSLEDVARVYGVPKAMLGDMERVTFSNFATARRVFWEDTIMPQLMFYQEALNQMLAPSLGDPSLFVEFDTSEVEALRESESEKAARRRMYVSAGIITVNEARGELNLPPVPWGDGPRKSPSPDAPDH